MKKNKNFFESLKHALDGIVTLYKEERNMWFHTLAMLIVIIAGILLKVSVGEWVILALSVIFVFASETVNTLIERMMDKISTEYDANIKKIKDISASFVLLVSLGAAVVGILIFLPKIIALF